MKKIVVLTLMLTMVITGYAFAGTDAGYKEFGVNGFYSNVTQSNSSGETNTVSLGFVFNYYFSAYWSLGGNYRLTGSSSEYGGGSTTETTTQDINIRTDLLAGGPTKTVIPYIGLHLGNQSTYSESGNISYDSSSFSYGGQGGLKMFPSERVSVNLELDYTTTTVEEDFGDYERDTISLFVGASFYF